MVWMLALKIKGRFSLALFLVGFLDGQCCPFSLFVNIVIFDMTCMAAGVGGN